MNNKNKHIIFLMFLLFCGASLMAQPSDKKLQRADRLFKNEQWQEAETIYREISANYSDPEIYRRLGVCYENLGEDDKAGRMFKTLADNEGHSPEMVLEYADWLKSNGHFGEAIQYYGQYKSESGDDMIADQRIEACNLALTLMQQSDAYEVRHLPFNSPENDFAAIRYEGQLYFTSNMVQGANLFTKANTYYEVYSIDGDFLGQFGKPRKIKGEVNTKYHDGPVAFEGNVMYYSRTNAEGKDLLRNTDGRNKIKIASAMLVEDKWVEIGDLSFIDPEYSYMHPAISPDGKKLYFSSDLPGGYGGFDLWYVEKNYESWLDPVNLGPLINTGGDEVFPYLHTDGFLYFSSDGHPGMGRMDIYLAGMEFGRWTSVKNMGYPVNSESDDFGITWIEDKASGYFASDRKGGFGGDDIYEFNRKFPIKGQVVDASTNEPIEGARVVFTGTKKNAGIYDTDAEGNFQHFADWGRILNIRADKKYYIAKEFEFDTREMSPSGDMEIVIELLSRVLALEGKVVDFETGAALSGCSIRIFSDAEQLELVTESEGVYDAILDPTWPIDIVISKPGYIPEVINLDEENYASSTRIILETQLKSGSSFVLEGKALRQKTGEPLSGVDITAMNEAGKKVMTAESRDDGRFWMILDKGNKYSLNAGEQDYFVAGAEIDPDVDFPDPPIPGEPIRNGELVSLDMNMVDYAEGETFKTIYFGYGEADLTWSSSRQLDQIAIFSSNNPDAIIEVSAHTDSRGSNEFNLALSDRRARAAVNYLISKGIPGNRIFARGYGESRLLNPCSDGIPCSEEEHRENRRVEAKVVTLKDNYEDSQGQEYRDY